MSTKPVGDAAQESSPLLDRAASQCNLHERQSIGNGHNHLLQGNRIVSFLFSSKHTSGLDSDKIGARGLVYTWHIFKVTLLSSTFIVFMNAVILVPVGIIAGCLGWSSSAVFIINVFAIVPLAAILSFATEQISLRLGETLGGLLNATFGNAVELIVSIIALKQNQIMVVQAPMLGSILYNLLPVLGMCFFFGGIVHRGQTGNGIEQSFASATAQTTCSMMTISSASLVIPAAPYAVLDQKNSQGKAQSILTFSRGTAIILLILYIIYLAFQLRTHSNLFDTKNQNPEDQEQEEPEAGPVAAAAVLVVTTVLVAICAEYLVDAIDDLVDSTGINKAFVGLVLIPIVGNAAEHATAIVVALRDNMDLAIIQIALLVTPFLVIIGWIMGREMTLHFETFQTVAFAVSVLVVTYVVQDGKSNYLEGAMLFSLYAIIALALYATPSDAFDNVTNLVSRGN